MSLLFAFALSWAILRAVEQAGTDTRTGISRARQAARERARQEVRARAARIRRSGTRTEKAALWVGTRGVATMRGTGRGLRATGRGVRQVSRSTAAGWRSGWAEGKDRHAAYTARREGRRARKAPVTGHVAAPQPEDPTYRTTPNDGAGTPDTKTPGQPAGNSMQAPTEGGASVSFSTTGEAPNIETAREVLKAIAQEAEQTNTAIDSLSASLASADMDSQTLQEVSEILEAADELKTAADQALAGMDSRHQAMEEAVNSTPHAAKTEFYRH